MGAAQSFEADLPFASVANAEVRRLELGSTALPCEPSCVTWSADLVVKATAGTPLFTLIAYLAAADGAPTPIFEVQSVNGRASLMLARDYTAGQSASLAAILTGSGGAWAGALKARGAISLAAARGAG